MVEPRQFLQLLLLILQGRRAEQENLLAFRQLIQVGETPPVCSEEWNPSEGSVSVIGGILNSRLQFLPAKPKMRRQIAFLTEYEPSSPQRMVGSSMRNCVRRCPGVLLVTLCLGAVLPLRLGETKLSAQEMTEVSRPNISGRDPHPQDAIKGILDAFDKYEVVGMSAAHGHKDLDDFILNLIRDPELPSKINDIVVECGNSLYQPILDRYIAGDEVPLDEARQVWRNTTQPMCSVSAFYEQLFPLVRRINQKLPVDKKLRMLACDPAIDWSTVKTRDELIHLMNRNVSIASVLEKEVLSKHRKALVLIGVAHLYHKREQPGSKTAVEAYEETYPGVTLVIADHTGFGNYSPLSKFNEEFESRMASWPIPSLVQDMSGTWLADLLDKTHTSGGVNVTITIGKDGKRVETRTGPGEATKEFSKMVDAYLYLGPRDLLLGET